MHVGNSIKAILFTLLLAGCQAHTGGYHRSKGGISYDDIKCEVGKPYYFMVGIYIDFPKERQKVNISWQCKENDGARIYLDVDEFSINYDDIFNKEQ